MDSKRLSYLVGCLVLGLAGLLNQVRATSGSNKCGYPAIFNFGDSNSDTGTIYALTFLRPPNGETFFGNVSKRACDGRVIIDFIAEELKMPYLSAYLDSVGSNYSHGANFAAGGSSIREGGYNPLLPLAIQISQFIQFKSRAIAVYNQSPNVPRPQDFSKALYTIDIGQNDLSRNFRNTSEEQVRAIPAMLSQLSQAIQTLYEEGARAFWIHNTGPQGCLPLRAKNNETNTHKLDSNGCIRSSNRVAKHFNRQLKKLVFALRKELPLAKLVYVDVYKAKYQLIRNAKNLGFRDPMEFCCGDPNAGLLSCTYDKKCKEAWRYVSWDGVHYTEAANHWVAKRIVNGSLSQPRVPIGESCRSK